jgi:transposase-like protein
MKWKKLSGQERYRVVQMVRERKIPIKEICRSFGVSRQTLKTSMDKAEQASMEALTPKSPGRKGKSKAQSEADMIKQEKDSLQKELDRWKQKYEIAMAFLDIHKKLLNGQELPGEPKHLGGKKKLKSLRNQGSAKTTGADRTGAKVAPNSDG